MLKINVIAIGKNKSSWIDEAITHYQKLLRKYARISFIYIPDIKKTKDLKDSELSAFEAALLLKKSKANYKIALSDRGQKYNSEEFAEYLSKLMLKSGGVVDIIIGGIYGLDGSVLEISDNILSLSPMTMSHQLIRPVLLEQLFRGFSILAGGKYHK